MAAVPIVPPVAGPPGGVPRGAAKVAASGTPSGPPTGTTSPVAGIERPAASADPAALAKSAQDFEAMAIGQLLEPMFDSVDTAHGLFGGGEGEEAWKPMLVQAFAKQIEAHGGLGLAKPVYEAMIRMQEAGKK